MIFQVSPAISRARWLIENHVTDPKSWAAFFESCNQDEETAARAITSSLVPGWDVALTLVAIIKASQKQEASEYAYVARKKCGCIAAAVTEDSASKHGKDIAKWIGEGLIIERIPVEEVRIGTWVSGCPHEPVQQMLDLG